MDLQPRLLRSFVAVAEELHFGRAARRLHISQPPLSMQIRKLEDEVGARLLERDRRHVTLTEAGAHLLERARVLLAELERAGHDARRISEGELGTLVVGYTPTATYEVLPPLVWSFRSRRPGIRLELIELRSGAQPAALEAGRIELGLACGPVGAPGIAERVLAREAFVLAAHSRHALIRRNVVHVRDLRGEHFVAVRREVEPAWADAGTRALARAGVFPQVVQETDTKLALLGLVAANLGVALVSASMRRVNREGVVFRELAGLSVRVPLVALTTARPSSRTRAFLGGRRFG